MEWKSTENYKPISRKQVDCDLISFDNPDGLTFKIKKFGENNRNMSCSTERNRTKKTKDGVVNNIIKLKIIRTYQEESENTKEEIASDLRTEMMEIVENLEITGFTICYTN